MSGELSWFALRVTPQRERMVQKILRYHGLNAFVKTEKRLRRKTKRDSVRTPTPFVVASSYVFIGLPIHDPGPWRLVHRYHMIRSVVSLNGRPVQIDGRALGEFLGFDDFDMPEYFKFFRTGDPPFGPGDTVRVDTPSFDGIELRVKDIQRGEALFDLIMLGRATEIRVPLDQVYRAA